MKKLVYLLFVLLFVLVSCGKDDPDPPEPPPPPPPPPKIEINVTVNLEYQNSSHYVKQLSFGITDTTKNTVYFTYKEENINQRLDQFKLNFVLEGNDAQKIMNQKNLTGTSVIYGNAHISRAVHDQQEFTFKNGKNEVTFNLYLPGG